MQEYRIKRDMYVRRCKMDIVTNALHEREKHGTELGLQQQGEEGSQGKGK
jgi:hypothetical protein